MRKALATVALLALSPGCSDLDEYLDDNWGSLIFFSISGIVSCWCFRCANGSNKMFQRMESTPISPVAEVQEGATEIKGRVKAKDDILVSPWGRKKCVYYKFKVEEEKSSGEGGTYTTTFVKEEECVPFVVTDETGEASVDNKDATYELKLDKHNRSGVFKSPTPELKQLLKTRYGKKTRGLIFRKALTYHETALEIDDEVYVFGTATAENPARNEGYLLQNGEMPLIITDKGGSSVELGYQKDGMTLMVIGGVASCFALLGFILLVT